MTSSWPTFLVALAAVISSAATLIGVILTHGKVGEVKQQVDTPGVLETLGEVVEKIGNGVTTKAPPPK